MPPVPWTLVARAHMDAVYVSVEVVIGLASVLGNVPVVLLLAFNRAWRETTFCFVASLALADVAVGTLVIPLSVLVNLGVRTPFHACLFLSCLLLVITQSSILSLLAIAVDRYLRVKVPTRYGVIMTQQRAWAVVCVCWLLSILTGMVPMLGWHGQDPQGNLSAGSIVCEFSAVMRLDFMVYFNFFGCVVAPLAVMISLYTEIFRVIRCRLGRRAKTAGDAGKYYRRELRLAKSLALVVLLFALCWLPLHITNCVILFCPGCEVPKRARYVGIFMSHVNSAVNPLVYAFRIERVRAMLAQTLRQFWGRPKSARPTAHLALSTPGGKQHVYFLNIINGLKQVQPQDKF
ncbi:adenosine receptor A1-like [Megalops cyprinoides]|uniref:adenosine receptor A1-like n=1 Tax=Megalops cyprinoides TaxID=118141 RepID=UPI001864AE8F|nr:adenosine receptor A1-like [Megalops cyprinoides]